MSYFSVEINEENIRSIDIESIIGDNPATIEVQNYNNIIIDTSNTLSLTPLEVVEALNTRIVDFLEAGSGIYFDIDGDSFTINSSTLPHLHSTNDIVGLSSYVINNAPVRNILASSGVVVQNNSGIFSIALSNPTLQSSNISDFNQSVSGLLPVKGLLSGSGISVTNNDNVFTVAVTGNFGLTSEQVDDRVSQLLQAGSNIILSYNDDLNRLEISTSGLQPSGNYSIVGHNHNVADINNLQLILDLKQPSGDYSLVGHSHIPKDVFSNINWAGDYNNFITYSPGSAVRFNGEVWVMHTFIGAAGYVPNITHWTKIGEFTNSSSQINDFASAVSGYAPVKSVAGKDGIVTLNKSDVGLSNVDNTSDLNKPISTSVQLALDTKQPSGNYSLVGHSHSSSDISNFNSSVSGLINGIYAPLNSPSLTGVPIAPTAPSGTSNNQIANTQFVRTEISNLVNSAPSTLDTLNELATALGNDPNFATTVSNNLGQKANLSGASFTGTVSAPSGNFSVLQQNGINVSVSGHQHSYTDITNFASGIDQEVSTLLVAGSYIDVDYDAVADTLTINATGLQPSGNYSVVGHTHISSNITNFNSSVSGLIPTVSGGPYITSTFNSSTNNYSVKLNIPDCKECDDNWIVIGGGDGQLAFTDHIYGYQVIPESYSGDAFGFEATSLQGIFPIIDAAIYDRALKNHVHGNIGSSGNIGSTSGLLVVTGNSGILTTSSSINSSYINDFNASVSGLLPVQNIIGSGYVNVLQSGGTYTISTNGLQPSGNYSTVGHSHIISDISGLQTLLDNKASLSGANFTGPISSNSGTFDGIKLKIGNINNPGISFSDAPVKLYRGLDTNSLAISLDGINKSIDLMEGLSVFKDEVAVQNTLYCYSLRGSRDTSTGFDFL
jgi:hypothetical protein